MKKKARVFITRPVPEVGIKLLKKRYEVVLNKRDRVLTKKELIRTIKGKNYSAILTLLTDKIDEEVLDAAGNGLKIVANYAVGFDNIDVKVAKEKNVFVTNTPGVLTEAVGEHTFALLMAAAKHIPQADRFVRDGRYKQWEPLLFLGPSLWGKTLGLIGLGRIGSSVAQIAREGYKMNVLYYDVKRSPEFEMMFEANYHEMDYLLKHSDFVSLHVPLIIQTHHLIGLSELRMMKRTAILINTSRGGVINEKALVRALRKKWLYAAGLDVFENEPKLTRGLKDLPNVVLTPHTASGTIEARSAMSEIAAKNIIEALSGRTPMNLAK